MASATKQEKRAETLKELILLKDPRAPLNFKNKSRWSLVRGHCCCILLECFFEIEHPNIRKVIDYLEEDGKESENYWNAYNRYSMIGVGLIDFYAHLVFMGYIKDALKKLLE